MLDPQRSPTDDAAQEAFRLALLNPWQHHFPLEREPFARIAAELGWKPSIGFEDGLRDTVKWYLA